MNNSGLRRYSLLVLVVIGSIGAATITTAQTSVFVPGTAAGCFGNILGICNPLVPALTVSGPGTITVSYVSGLVTWSPGAMTGPNGGTCSVCPCGCVNQTPLSEAQGVAPQPTMTHVAALMGVFVPRSRVLATGFQAVDGTKNIATVGIVPSALFFIGEGKTFPVSEAGTLFLGVNDWWVDDNAGGFNVTVTGR